MANSAWSNDPGAFGPLHETRNDKERTEAQTAAFFTEQFAVLEIHDELELTDGCEACFAWVFGQGPECATHRYELKQVRTNGTWWREKGETGE